ncbi:putative xyloglucan 6-xylosyltransferase 3 [Dissostichus eleginoides]|uniref:Xyloglucan 6-xylosyltransferase 3 n=1 Tax=Dissostichus eleginoides TaxID=100907 RepID=A0AAD9BSK2_DISEL|nr:putative xyloglucan 6-xylosyltransferase 3 [Dissostichus eleginoides]
MLDTLTFLLEKSSSSRTSRSRACCRPPAGSARAGVRSPPPRGCCSAGTFWRSRARSSRTSASTWAKAAWRT